MYDSLGVNITDSLHHLHAIGTKGVDIKFLVVLLKLMVNMRAQKFHNNEIHGLTALRYVFLLSKHFRNKFRMFQIL